MSPKLGFIYVHVTPQHSELIAQQINSKYANKSLTLSMADPISKILMLTPAYIFSCTMHSATFCARSFVQKANGRRIYKWISDPVPLGWCLPGVLGHHPRCQLWNKSFWSLTQSARKWRVAHTAYCKYCTLSNTPTSSGPVLTLETALYTPLLHFYLFFFSSYSNFTFFPPLYLTFSLFSAPLSYTCTLYLYFLLLRTPFSFFSSSLHLFPMVIFLSLSLFLFFLFPFSPLPHIFSFFRASFFYMYNVHIFFSSPRSFLFFSSSVHLFVGVTFLSDPLFSFFSFSPHLFLIFLVLSVFLTHNFFLPHPFQSFILLLFCVFCIK